MLEPNDDPKPHFLPDELIDWPARLANEESLILRVLAGAPSKRVLDLGCGTGRHARFLAQRGFEVVGIDGSERALELAQKEPLPGVEFLLGEMGAVERSVRGHFGAALCLGNTLPYLLSPESLSRMLVGLKRRLLPGAPLLVQTLNYDRNFAGAHRALPVQFVSGSFRDSGDGGESEKSRESEEMAVVRIVEPRDDGFVVLMTSALRFRPAAVPPMELLDTRSIQLRGWKREELEIMFEVARFEIREVHGDMSGGEFDAQRSQELVMVVG